MWEQSCGQGGGSCPARELLLPASEKGWGKVRGIVRSTCLTWFLPAQPAGSPLSLKAVGGEDSRPLAPAGGRRPVTLCLTHPVALLRCGCAGLLPGAGRLCPHRGAVKFRSTLTFPFPQAVTLVRCLPQVWWVALWTPGVRRRWKWSRTSHVPLSPLFPSC